MCAPYLSRLWWLIGLALLALPLTACQEDEAGAPVGATIRVGSIGDTNERDGVLTLREAMVLATGVLRLDVLDAGEAANVSGSPGDTSADVIVLDKPIFPPSEPATIALIASLPPLDSGGDTIDAAGAGVIISGGSRTFDCLVVASAGNTVSGLQVRGCKIGLLLEAGAIENTIGGVAEGQGNLIGACRTGLRIEAGADRNVVAGNRIGASRPARTADANEFGIFVGGAGNVIGGGNIVSGSQRVGLTVAGEANTVSGNYIGTDSSGSSAVPNAVEGIWVAGRGNTIGGSTAAERNVISGNGLFGINVSGSGAAENVVKGNYIGVDAAGNAMLANRNGLGVTFGARNNIIGGVEQGEENVISGNVVGVLLRDAGTTGNVFHGNRIGVDAAGLQPLPNGTGISALNGAQNNAIGGTGEGEGNVILASAVGVLVDGGSTTGITLRGNSVWLASGARIELRDGGNGGIEPPTVNSVGPVRGNACAGCTIDVYSNDDDGGQIYEGSGVADAEGRFEVRVNPDGPTVTATATDANGNTSAFSRPVAVP